LYPWALDESQIDACCKPTPLGVEDYLLGRDIPLDVVKIVLQQCELGVLGRLGLTRRGLVPKTMSQATRIRLFTSVSDALFLRMALAVFGLRMLGSLHFPAVGPVSRPAAENPFLCVEMKFREREARNFRQLTQLPLLASYSADQIPKAAIFAACKSIECIFLDQLPEHMMVAKKGYMKLQNPIRTLSKLFPNITSLHTEAQFWGEPMDLMALSSWPKLQLLIVPGESRSIRDDEADAHLPTASAMWKIVGALQNLTELDFPMFNEGLSQLTNLVKLSLRVRHGPVSFRTLSVLTKLERLEINTEYALYSIFPWNGTNFDAISTLGNLRELILPGLSILGTDAQTQMANAFCGLSRLEKVDFEKCETIRQLPADLFAASAQTLSSVTLSESSSLVNIDALISLPLLSSLELVGIQCSNAIVSAILQMSQLERLVVTTFTGGFRAFKGIADALGPYGRLRELRFEPDQSDAITDGQLSCLSALTSLETLFVHSYNVTADGFRPLTVLKKLRVISMYCPKLRKAQVEALFPGVEVIH
jgi:hypothetical protein